MKIIKTGVMLLLGVVVAMAVADTTTTVSAANAGSTEDGIRKLVEQRLPGAKVESVEKSQVKGLYEVRVGSDIMYADEKANYVIFGHMVDLKTQRDITAERIDAINKINFGDLPFDSAIKMVKGDGKRVIAVFEDPNCGYCKRLRHTLAKMDNVTVYTFMYNILAPDSSVKSRNVWCAGDRLKAWDDWMLDGKAPAAAPETCTSNPNEQISELGKKFRINATPTIFFTDGSRAAGALDTAGLEKKWASIQ